MLASASMSVALILSQRDSAVGLLEAALPSPLAADLLSKLANDQIFATIGIAQLTTSRQGGPPALRALPTSDGWQLDGIIPWATGRPSHSGSLPEPRRTITGSCCSRCEPRWRE